MAATAVAFLLDLLQYASGAVMLECAQHPPTHFFFFCVSENPQHQAERPHQCILMKYKKSSTQGLRRAARTALDRPVRMRTHRLDIFFFFFYLFRAQPAKNWTCPGKGLHAGGAPRSRVWRTLVDGPVL